MRTRTKVRMVLLIVGVPLAIAALWFGVKLISLQVITGQAIAEYEAGDFDASERTIDPLVGDSLVDGWLPYFDRGDARAGQLDYTSAIDDYERALSMAPADRRCMVALNLALAWETLGDSYEQQGSHAGAAQLYANAKKVLDGVAKDCQDSSPQEQQEQQEQDDRVQQKQQDAEQNAQAQQQADPQQQEDQQQQLEQKQQDSEQQKQDAETREDGGANGGQPSTDKPW